MESRLDFEGLARVLVNRAGEFLPSWLPGGRMMGKEYVCGSLRGGEGSSCSVNLATGKWADFSGDEKGGDLISLFAAIEGISQGEAAKRLADQVNFRLSPNAPAKGAEAPRDLDLGVPPTDERPGMAHPRHGEPTGKWVYLTPEGRPMFWIARYETDQGKQFYPWSWSRATERWVMKGWPAPRPLYGLNLLAERPDAPVMVVEGEKAADAARELLGRTYVVVTWPNGAKGAGNVDWRPLYGRRIIVWPDRDLPGIKAGKQVAELLLPHCPEVKFIDVAYQLSNEFVWDGWDAADALAEGWTRKRLVEWARALVQIVLPAPATSPTIAASAAAKNGSGVAAAAQASVTVNVANADDYPASSDTFALWEQLGIDHAHGKPTCNIDTVTRALDHYPDFKDIVWFDTFYNRYLTRWRSEHVREWGDVDEIKLALVLQRDLGLAKATDDVVHRAIIGYANDRRRNEPRDWLESLSWDGNKRIDYFFPECFGAPDNEYTQAVSRNFFIGMIARVLDPGAQVDNMVVLEGAQGTGKTRGLRILGGKWYAEATESVTAKDFFMTLQGKLIVEIAELDAFSRAEVTRIKQVVTCTNDRFRAPYERAAKDHPRTCIFVGTTNEMNYLQDSTGGRRFWPIKCGLVNWDYIDNSREQCFAEAVARYRAGELWYKMPVEKTEEEQETRRFVDEWEETLSEFLEFKSEAKITELVTGPLKIEIGRMDRVVVMRVAKILRRLGWERVVKRNGLKTERVWSKKSP